MFLYCLQGLHQAGGIVHDLAVGEGLAGPDGVAVADLPGGDAHLFRHFVEQGLDGKAGLGYPKAPEGSGRGVVGVPGVAVDLEVLIVVRAGRMGAGPLQHRAAQAGIGAGIRHHLGLYALNDAVLIAPQGEFHIHGVALGMDQDAFLAGELAFHRPAGQQGA